LCTFVNPLCAFVVNIFFTQRHAKVITKLHKGIQEIKYVFELNRLELQIEILCKINILCVN